MAERDQAARDQIQALKKIEQSDPLPGSEWNFSQLPPEWQMYHWLNYEYARTSRTIVQGVLHLRARELAPREVGTLPKRSSVPSFAGYLARNYPEFPTKPWLELRAE